MARLKRSGKALVGVPVPLRSHLDPVWHDAARFERFCDECGIVPAELGIGDLRTARWWQRFDRFRTVWCVRNGLAHPQYRDSIDYERAEAAGVDLDPMSYYRMRPDDTPFEWRMNDGQR